MTLSILQVSTADFGGGAERVAWSLFDTFRVGGHRSRLVVGLKRSTDPDVYALDNSEGRSLWSKMVWRLETRTQGLIGRRRGALRLNRLLRRVAQPGNVAAAWRGREPMDYPATWRLLSHGQPDIIHAHNLHGEYFDLRALPQLSRNVPMILTLHDAWLLSGHCAHSFECERWKTGCGACPDLTIPPAIRRDATAENWVGKRAIFAQSRLYISTPCQWLMGKVTQSMLAPAAARTSVIPYGVDLALYRPWPLEVARAELGLPLDAHIVLFVANSPRRNVWKDLATLRQTLGQIATLVSGRLIFLALGEPGPVEHIGSAEMRFVPFQSDPQRVARHYQAADVYLHAARADTFPNTVLEAQACATPVVATAIGGIPEQVEEAVTGYLVPPRDAAMMAARAASVLNDPELRRKLSAQAAESARRRFDLKRYAADTLNWYREVITDWRAWKGKTNVAAG